MMGSAGSMYWLSSYGYDWDGRVMRLMRPKGGERNKKYHAREIIDAQQIAQALTQMLKSGNTAYVHAAARVLAHEADGQDNDLVLQFAAFGAVVYG